MRLENEEKVWLENEEKMWLEKKMAAIPKESSFSVVKRC